MSGTSTPTTTNCSRYDDKQEARSEVHGAIESVLDKWGQAE